MNLILLLTPCVNYNNATNNNDRLDDHCNSESGHLGTQPKFTKWNCKTKILSPTGDRALHAKDLPKKHIEN